MPEKEMAAIIKTISDDPPIEIDLCEYSKYALNANMTDINDTIAEYHIAISVQYILTIKFLVNGFLIIPHISYPFFGFINHILPSAKKETGGLIF